MPLQLKTTISFVFIVFVLFQQLNFEKYTNEGKILKNHITWKTVFCLSWKPRIFDFKIYLLLEFLSISPQIWNLCSWHKFKSLLCNDCCNFAPNSFYEVNHFKFCNPHSWLTSYLSFGARYHKSLHNKNSKYL